METQRLLPLRVAPWVLIVLLVISNVALIRQNYLMRKALEVNQPDSLQTGERLLSFSAKTAKGEAVSIAYAGQGPRKLFFYFTPTCKFCRKQFAYWHDILTKADAQKLEVIGLVKESEDPAKLEDFLKQMSCGSDSPTPLRVVFVSDDLMRSYKLSPTPLTLLVSNNGTVERAWIGLWDDANLSAASSILGITIAPRQVS